MSTLSSYFFFLTSSGAMYNGEPKIKVIPLSRLNYSANPKSINFNWKSLGLVEVNIRFSNLRSLCAMFFEWMKVSVWSTCLTIRKAVHSVNGLPFSLRRLMTELPCMYSLMT